VTISAVQPVDPSFGTIIIADKTKIEPMIPPLKRYGGSETTFERDGRFP